MTDILFTANGASATALVSGELTAGMVGVPARFSFDSDWAGLNVIAVFEGSCVSKSVPLLDETSVTVPWECLVKANTRLRIGAEGRKSDGSVVIPTVWANVDYIKEGAKATDDLGNPPTPGIYDQIMAAIEAGKLKGEKGDQGDTGAQGPAGPAGPQGEKGEKGDKGDSPAIADDLYTKDSTVALSANMGAYLREKTETDLLTVQKDLEAQVKERVKTVNGVAPDENGNVEIEIGGGGSAIDYDKTVKAVNHRGYNSVAPENTIPAYILSKQMGFNYVEADISFTSDGVAVLLHDATIDRTSNGSGNISAMTYADVLQHDFGSWKSAEYAGTKIASFEEFIAVCRGIGLHPYIELTNNGAYTESQIQGLVDIVKSYGMADKVTWISFTHTYLGYVKSVDPSARLGLLCWSDWTFDYVSGTVQTLKTDTNEVFLNVNSAWAVENYAQSKDAGIPVEVWTVNSEDEIKNLNPYVSGVTSDNLIAGKVLYDKYMEHSKPVAPTTYSVTNNLTNATNSNSTAKVAENAAYTASITAADGYTLSAVTVVMGGVDVTASVYSNGTINISAVTGNIVITAVAVETESEVATYTITNSLTNVSSNNSTASVTENASYTATLTAGEGYNLDSVKVTMGGTDITAAAYANGVVNISAVTGNVVITATAVKAPAEPVLLHNWDLTSSMTDTVGGVVATTTGTQDSNGLTISKMAQYCDFGEVYGLDRTFELDVVSSVMSRGVNNGYGRLLMVDTDTETGTGGSGLIHGGNDERQGWQFYAYNNGGWGGLINPQLNSTKEDCYGRGLLDGKTVQMYVSAEKIATLYVDGVEMGSCPFAFIDYPGGHIYMGASIGDILYTTIVTGFRVYSGLHI